MLSRGHVIEIIGPVAGRIAAAGGIENPDAVVHALFLKNRIQSFPTGDKNIGIQQIDQATVAGPVGVHLIVQSEQHGLAVRLDLPGDEPQTVIHMPAVHLQGSCAGIEHAVVGVRVLQRQLEHPSLR